MSHFKEDPRNKYKLKQKKGCGVYTEVYEAENKVNKEIRAIKIINLKMIRSDLDDEYSEKE